MMKNNRFYLLILLSFALLLLFSCSDSNNDAPTDQNPHVQSWLNPSSGDSHGPVASHEGIESCAGCHALSLTGSSNIPGCFDCHFNEYGSREPAGESWSHGLPQHGLYTEHVAICNNCHDTSRKFNQTPNDCHNCHTHPLGQPWMDKKSEAFHGIEAMQALSGCSPCHGEEYLGGETGVSCYQCHFDEAGSRNSSESPWLHDQPHADDNLTQDEVTCNHCHNTNRDYDNNPPSQGCHDCHTHPIGQPWLDKKSEVFHGIAAIEALAECAPCHGEDYFGGVTGVSCSQCHFDETGTRESSENSWFHDQPHADDSLSQYEETCNQCHNTNRTYDNNPLAQGCHDCHIHSIGQLWLDKRSETFHGIAALQDLTECSPCHGEDYLGGVTGVSCSQCHFDEAGSRNPSDNPWLHDQPHDDDALTQYEETCNQCHNTNRAYDNNPPGQGCHDCHTHPSGQPWLDNKSETFHGIVAAQALSECSVCHGDDFLGGVTGVSCLQCHFDETGSREPFESSWMHDQPHDDDALTQYETTCNQCHNTNRSYENNPPAQGCHDCHTHDSSVDWLLRTNHAASAIDDPALCQACHVTTDCRVCHVQSDPLFVIDACSSCHGTPPDSGEHLKDVHEVNCSRCHSGAGAATVLHYDNDSSADISFNSATMSYDDSLKNCTGTCHGYFHDAIKWWDD